MSVQFRYKEERSEIMGRISRPIADIEFLSVEGEWIDAHPYIGSGAAITVIPYTFGRLLGFKLAEAEVKELRGVGGSVLPIILKEVDMRIGKFQLKGRVAWSLAESVPFLLGRLDIFDKYNFMFRQSERIVEVDPINLKNENGK